MKKILALVAIMKDEGRYLLEWIAHYRVAGIQSIIIYDNDSSDEGKDLLERLSDNGVITLHKWSVENGVSPQLSAYADAVKRYRDEFEYLAFFDADEFLIQKSDLSLMEWLQSVKIDVGAIAVNQRVFGSSGHKEIGSGLVIERFQRAAELEYDENRWVKSIYRSSAIDLISDCHRGKLKAGNYILPNGNRAFGLDNMSGKAEEIDFSLFQLNHYILKSEEEFFIKRKRGGGMGSTQELRLKRYEDLNFFRGRDVKINDASDDTLAQSADRIKQEIFVLERLLLAT